MIGHNACPERIARNKRAVVLTRSSVTPVQHATALGFVELLLDFRTATRCRPLASQCEVWLAQYRLSALKLVSTSIRRFERIKPATSIACNH